MKTDIYGHLAVTVVDGTTLTGIWAADGSLNVFDATSSSGYVGLMHPCGAINCVVVSGTTLVGAQATNGALNVINDSVYVGFRHPSGAMNVTNYIVSGAATLLKNETNGLAIDFTDMSIQIKDTTTPANAITSTGSVTNGVFVGPSSKITYTAPSAKLLEQSDGALRYQAHNLYLNSAAPANQAITVVSGGTYEIVITGSVSITWSGAYVGTTTAGTTSITAATGTLTGGSTSGSGTVQVRRTPCSSEYIATAGTALYALPYRYSRGVLQGIEVEPQSTNLCYPSSTFASGYNGSNLSVAAASVLLPTGLTGGGSLTETNVTAAHFCYPTSLAGGLNSLTDHAISVTVKANTARYLVISLQGTANNFASAVFDTLNVGAMVASQTGLGSSSGTVQSTSQTTRTDGWVTCVLVARCGTSCTPVVGLANAATGNTFGTNGLVSYLGFTSNVMYIDHLQVEAALSPTSRIVTYGAAVLRAADQESLLTALFPYGATQGTVFLDYTPKNVLSASSTPVLGFSPASRFAYQVTTTVLDHDGTAPQTYGTIAANIGTRLALAFGSGSRSLAKDGALVVTDAAFDGDFASASNLYFGSVPGFSTFHGTIRRVAYFTGKVSNSVLPTIGA